MSTLILPGDLTAPARARAYSRAVLACHGIHPLSTFADELQLCVSEAVTNAVIHGQGAPVLTILRVCDRELGDTISVTVHDDGPMVPYRRVDEHGWGLILIAELAENAAIIPADPGKDLIFLLPVPAQHRPAARKESRMTSTPARAVVVTLAAAAALTTVVQPAGATTWNAPRAAVTAAHKTVTAPDSLTLAVRTSACVTAVQATADDGLRMVSSTVAARSGNAIAVTLRIPASAPAGRWAVSSVTARLCGDCSGAAELLPAAGGTFAAFTIVHPTTVVSGGGPGTGLQEG